MSNLPKFKVTWKTKWTLEDKIKFKGKQVQTLLPNVSSIWAFPSKNSKNCQNYLLKNWQKQGFRQGSTHQIVLMTLWKSVIHVIYSWASWRWVFCDCYEGSKARMCKHSVGLMFKTEEMSKASPWVIKEKEADQKNCQHVWPRALSLR